MRILFLENHPMWIHGLPNGFRDAGHEVKISGPLLKRNIPKILATFRPHLIITLGWTEEHSPPQQQIIRKYVSKSRIPHVYWATEDPTHTKSFTLPYIRYVKPDFVFTISPKRAKQYKKIGFPSAYLDFGYHSKVHRPVKPLKKYKRDIAIVANAYPRNLTKYPYHYRIQSLRNLIRPLIKTNIRVDFWGKEWEKMKPILGVKIPKKWIHGYLPYTEANKVYSSAKIVIGLQNRLTQVTQRTYEILGSGGFLLTNDTPEIRRLFKNKKHLVVSKSAKKTLDLVRYYLKHSKERKRIRRNGLKAVTRHSYKRRAMQMIRVLKKYHIL